jgi:hypothetical protein
MNAKRQTTKSEAGLGGPCRTARRLHLAAAAPVGQCGIRIFRFHPFLLHPFLLLLGAALS